MRNKSMRSSRSIARLMALALCFVMMFALAVVAIEQVQNSVANADGKVRVYDADSYNDSNVQADSGCLSASKTGLESLMGYGSLGKTNTWTVSDAVTFNDWEFTKSSFTYGSENSKVKSVDVTQITQNGSNVTIINSPLDGNDSVVFVFNISLPSYLQNLLTGNEEFSLTFDAEINVCRGQNGTTDWKRAMAKIGTSAVPISATNSDHNSITGANKGGGVRHDDYGYEWNKTEEGYSNGSWKESSWSSAFQFSSLTLNKATPNIYVCIGIGDRSGCNVAFKDLKLTNIKITKTTVADSDSVSRVDGAAPAVKSQYVDSVSDSFYPYRANTENTVTANGVQGNDWNVWYQGIEGQLSKVTDSVSNGTGKLRSYTNTSLGTVGGNQYYKSSSITYHDMYNYLSGKVYELDSYDSEKTGGVSVASKLAQDIDINYASGIKRVVVGDQYQNMDAEENKKEAAVFNLYDTNSYGTDHGKAIYIEGKVVGWAVVTKTNRAEVVVNTYMYTNATVITRVSDYGDSANTWRIEYSGIDTKDPSANTTMERDKYIGTSSDGIDWYREATLSQVEMTYATNEDSSDADYSPYIWFYTVQRADSKTALEGMTAYEFSDYASVKKSGILPIACGDEISSFKYDFTSGYAQALGGVQGNPVLDNGAYTGSSEVGPKGAGYYKFTFYTFDLAGNKGISNSYYMKVDYETVNYSIDFSYGSGDGKVNILPSGTKNLTGNSVLNGAWATDDITLKIKANAFNSYVIGKDEENEDIIWDSRVGFSGYTLSFVIDDEYHALIVDGYGESENVSSNTTVNTFAPSLVKYISPSAPQKVEGNKITISVKTEIGTLPVVVEYDAENREFTFTIKAQQNVNFAWTTRFETTAGQYTNTSDLEETDNHVDSNWNDGVNMLLDCTNPENPVMHDVDDESAYLNSLGGYAKLPGNRVWYTDSYKTYPAIIDFYDNIIESNYVNQVNVYYGFKVVKTLAELEALGALDIPNAILNGSFADVQSLFHKSEVLNGNNFDSKSKELTIDLISGQDAGMRVFYVWAQDQAGNKSAVSTYYLFADVNTYTISAKVKNNSTLGRTGANIAFVNQEGEATTTFKRGETVFFTLSVEDGYSPYTLSLNDAKLLENYKPGNVKNGTLKYEYAWTSVESSKYLTIDNTSFKSVEYVVDDAESLARLDSKQAFEFAHRKIVDYTVTNTKVGYTAEPTDVFAQTVFSDIASKSVFEFKFYDSKENELASAPKNTGSYYVALYIPKDNDTYVTDDFAMDEDGNQTFDSIAYEIIKGSAIITATATTSVYGDKVELKYTLSGVSEGNLYSEGFVKSEGDKLTLTLKGVGNDIPNVGTYQVECTNDFGSVVNYDVTFVGAVHIISQRDVNVYALGASKQYKEADPELRFGVKESDFDEATQAEIFAGYRQEGKNNGYIVYFADGRLSRESGEVVGKYPYINTADLFDVNSNYKVVLQTANTSFEITQRVVTLDVSGQSSVYPYGTSVDIAQIIPTYRLSANDEAIASEIAELIESLTLGTSTKLDATGYDSVTGYKIVLSAKENKNIKVVIDEDAQYIVYITAQSTIIIKAKAGVKFESVYGLVSAENFSLPYSSDKFEIIGEPSGEYTNVSWSANINATGVYVGAGSYVVTFANAKLTNGETELADNVVVEQIVYTVKPANIVVKPIAKELAKTYGDAEDIFGIDFEIVTIAGYTPEQVANVIPIDVSVLRSYVEGLYTRAIYDKNGNMVSFATRYDGATENGVVIGSDGNYYSVGIANNFASKDANFTVEATLDDSLRFEINRKQLEIHTKDFVGVSKYYDGTTDVHYGSSAMYNIAEYLARPQDDVVLSASANYNTIGYPTRNTDANITFANIKLSGKSAHNYVLTSIVNDGLDVAVDNYSDSIDENVVITIYFVDKNDHIQIKMGGTITLSKSDITVSKQYDGTYGLTAGAISIKDRESDEGESTILLVSNKNMAIIGGTLSGKSVGTNYSIRTLVLFFPFEDEHLQGITIGELDGVVVEKDTYNGVSGLTVTVNNIGASITKRVLGADSFEFVTAVDREYNGNNIVDINCNLTDSVAISDQIVLKLKGVADGKNAGRHTVKSFYVNALSDEDNYTVDVDALKARFTAVEVDIAKATLTPNVKIKDMIYGCFGVDTNGIITTIDGKYITFTTFGDDSNKGKFTTINAQDLGDELDKVYFDIDKVSFILSLNGKENANVQANGLHNVLVSGLTIKFVDGVNEEEFAQNFKLAGSRYLDGKYIEITDVEEGDVSEYELIDFVVLSKKEIVLTSNDFKIEDKVYDSTTTANITIDIEKDAEQNDRLVSESHKDMLEVVATGKFEERNARNNLKVIIDSDSVELRVKSGTDGASIIGNYELVLSYDPEVYGNIKARPVAVSVDFGSQEYNGQENVKENNVYYGTPEGVLERDKNKVTMSTTGGAYYDNKNVALDSEGNVIAKNGTAYGVVLSNGDTNNYLAVYKSASRIEGKSVVAYIKDGEWVYYPAQSEVPSEGVDYYCYALEQTQKYIEISDENADKIAQALADDAIVGFRIVGGKDVYMLALGYEVEGAGSLDKAIAYLHGEGTVTKRVVRISASGIQMETGSKAFTKTYDGTTKFFGVESIGGVVGDYKITQDAINNAIEGDKVYIQSVTAVYESAKVGTTSIVFTASGITGEDSGNYTVEGKSALDVRLPAVITRLTIDAKLQDATRVYGSADVPSNVEYTLNGSALIQEGRVFYMNFKEWLVATGFINSAEDAVSEADKKYVESLYGKTYNLVDGEFVVADGGAGEYIILGGSNDTITELPKAKAQFTSTRPSAGTISASYTLSEGRAMNYEFNPLYTDGNTSKLEIVKKTLYIVTETKDFAKYYGGATPEVKLLDLDANGARGFASGEQWNTIFKIGSVDYGPVVKIGIFNRTDGTISPAGEMADISSALKENEVYVFYLEAPQGADYDSIANYTIVYQDINSVSVDADGNAVWNLAGATFAKSASTLTITLPELTGVSVGSNEENVFTYSKDVNWINEVLHGELVTDEVRFIIDGVESKAVDAGVYEGVITLKRYINANGDFVAEADKDANGRYIEWNSGDTKVKITVNKQTINLWADGMSVYYNGSNQSYLDSKIGNTAIKDETGITTLDKSEYTISYEVYDSKTNSYVVTKEIKNAGKYRVTVAFTDKFEQNHKNLAKGASVKADLYVLKAIVNVTISTDGFNGGSEMVDNSKVTSLTTTFDANANYQIGYTVKMDSKSNASAIAVDKSQTKLVLTKNGVSMGIDQIKEAGKYTFAIVLNDETLDTNNYTINGGAGVLELTLNKIDDSKGNTIDMGEGTITANRLVVKEVTQGSTIANDAAYLATINQHVAYLSKQAGYESDARVAAVYRVTLYCDDKIVTPDGEITVSVAMPDTIDDMDGIVLYTVTEDGGLQKLTDYKVEDGKIVYKADYVSGIVFVDTNPEGLASWIIYTIVAVVSFIVLVVVATVVAIIIRKARLKKLD